MANKKISELSTRTPSLSDLMLVGDPSSGYSYKCTITSLATIIETDIADGYVTLSTAQTISGAKTFSNNLTLTSVSNAGVDTDKFLVLNGSNVVNFRTGSEVLSDIGGQGALTLTTTGTSGAATLVGNTLNIPQYQAALTNPVTGTGTTNYIPRFSSSSAIDNSIMRQSGTSIGINTSPGYILDVFDSQSASIGVGTSTNKLVLVANDTSVSLQTTNDAFITFAPQQVAAMRITSGGIVNMGANFANNFNKLNVGGSATIGYTTTVVAPNDGLSVNGSVGIGFSGASTAQKLSVNGDVSIATINNATTDTDKFLVSDSGVIKYRTGTQLLSDIGGQGSLTLTTTGSSGSSTLVGNTLNVPTYTLAGLGGISLTSLSALAPLSYNNTTGAFSIALATASTDGYLRFQDWNFFADKIGGSGTTNYIPKFTGSSAIGNSNLINDASGNLGLGVTPSAWRSTDKVLQINNSSLFDENGTNLWLGLNFYENTSGSYIYTNTGYATAYRQQTGQHNWFTAPSGTAGNAISFTQAMTLDASGLLNVGGTGGTKRLNVFGDSRILNVAPTLDFTLSTNTAFSHSIVASNYSSSPISSNTLEFRVASGASTQATVMTLNGAGNVGIGTTSPNNKLVISNSGAYGFEFDAAGETLLTYNRSTSAYAAFNVNALQHTFQTSGTERMRITSGGDVGIGTQTPALVLEVNSSTTAALPATTGSTQSGGGRLRLTTTGASTAVIDFGTAGGSGGWVQATNKSDLATNYPFLINPNGGNVGIGTTNPIQPLTVAAASNANTIALLGRSSDNAQRIDFYNNAGNTRLFTLATGNSQTELYNDANIPMIFSTNAAERMRITSGGNVLIGTTTDSGAKLSVKGGTIDYAGDTRYGVSRIYDSSNGDMFGLEQVSAVQTGLNAATRLFTSAIGSADLILGKYTNATSFTSFLTLSNSGNAVFAGSIKTAAPSGGTAKPFKIGAAATVTPTSPNRTIEIEIDGVTYYLTAKTTND